MSPEPEVQSVDIITRRLTGVGVDCEQVIAVSVGGQRLEVNDGSHVTVEHEAGGIGATVEIDLLAARVRYVDESEAGPEEGEGYAPGVDDSVAIEGVSLEREGDSLLVKLRVDGVDVVVINAFDPYVPDKSPLHSIIVSPHGIRTAVVRHPSRPART